VESRSKSVPAFLLTVCLLQNVQLRWRSTLKSTPNRPKIVAVLVPRHIIAEAK
jgi:hypothetical protein